MVPTPRFCTGVGKGEKAREQEAKLPVPDTPQTCSASCRERHLSSLYLPRGSQPHAERCSYYQRKQRVE